jgi:hypothetical protein
MRFFFKGPTKRKQMLLVSADAVVILLTLAAAISIRVFAISGRDWPSFWVRAVPFVFVPLFLYLISLYTLELYGAERHWTNAVLLFRITAAVGVGVLLIAGAVFLDE